MKNIFWTILAVALSACSEPYRGFVLDGKIQGADNELLYLYYTDSLGVWSKDSVAVKEGKFSFRGGITEPTTASLCLGGGRMGMDDPNVTNFWIEPGAMKIALVKGDLKNYMLEGSATDKEAKELEQQKEPIMKELQPLIQAYYAEKDHEKAAEMRDGWEPYHERMGKIDEEFMATHPDSYVTAQILRYKTSSMSYGEAQAAYDRLGERVKKSRLAAEIRAEIRKLRMGSPGSPAARFAKADIHGEMFDLNDLKGKYVIIDFWASWCVPFRKCNPHLKELYRKYKDQGLEVVCVSDDDSNEEKWRAAVEKDDIGMFRHVLRGLKQVGNEFDRSQDISEKYGIHSLPTKILIDREGIIVGRYGGGGESHEKMDEKLKEVFGN